MSLSGQTDGKHVGTGCPCLPCHCQLRGSLTELPGTNAAEMFDALQAKMVMVKLEKLLETSYQLDHRDPSVVLLCKAQLKPQPNFLGQILKLFAFPWESREGL